MKRKILFVASIGIALIICCFCQQVFAAEAIGSSEPSINYSTYIQDTGWQQSVKNGEISGTTGKSLRIEAIKIQTEGLLADIKYQVHIQDVGWQEWKKNGEIAGSLGQPLRIEAIKIQLDSSEEYSIMYRAHIQGQGWQDWKFDGEIAGTEGQSLRLEAIEIKIVKRDKNPHIKYKGHVQDVGWQNSVIDGAVAGTEGRSLRLESIQINLMNSPQNGRVKYRAHVQDVGWQGWKYDGGIAGTSEKSLRLEAIQIELENMDKYTVEYRVHIENIGWTDWYIDGEIAGTTGQSKRLEAIQIRIVPHYKREYKGIDVSHHNGVIDWKKVKNSGIDFAIIRVGYGQDLVEQDDTRFEYNISECERLGIPYGVYIYSYALNTQHASSEADHVLRLLKGRKPEYGIWIDIEDDAYYTKYGFPTNEMFVNIATTFCEKIKANGHDTVGIYANLDWLYNRLNDSRLDKYEKWVAQWNDKCTYNKEYTMWQYTDKGKVDGISGDVDMNICYKK